MPRKNLTGGVRNCQVRSELFETLLWYGLPRRLSDEESACNARNAGLIPGLRRFPGEEKSNPLQSSCLENPICPFVTGFLSIMSSRFICVIACVRVPLISFFFFLRLSTFHCTYISYFVCPFIIWCTFVLLPSFSFCEERCYEHECTKIWVPVFNSIQISHFFFHDSVMESCVFLGIGLFHLAYSICLHTIVHSTLSEAFMFL